MKTEHFEPEPSHWELFKGFLTVGMYGFGGVLPWARWMMVDKRRWLDADGFNETLAFAQAMPGPNIINMSVVVGARFQGISGALVSLFGLTAMPFVIVIVLGLCHERWGTIPAVHHAIVAVSAAAAGLVLATAAKMLIPLIKARRLMPSLFAVLAFLGVGFFGLSLIPVLAVLAPPSIFLAWWSRK